MLNRPQTIEGRTALFQEATAIVEAEYNTDLSLDDVARRIHTSRRQLQRAYLEIGDTTFRDQLLEARMRKACELLASEPALSIRRVACQVGYQQPAQFTKAFRRRRAMTPGEYRAHARDRRVEMPALRLAPARPLVARPAPARRPLLVAA
jgi:AraC-like DNA-binding protein